MRSSFKISSLTAAGSLATMFALAACSDVTSPRAEVGDAAFTLGPTGNFAGAVAPIHFESTGATLLCASNLGATNPAAVPSTFTLPCPGSSDLMGALAVYNPGWDAPLGTSKWIGPTSTSNQYKLAPGVYSFVTTFTLPAGATHPVLNDTLMSDNAVAVYLNGHPVEAQPVQDCFTGNPCNWQQSHTFVISHSTAADFFTDGVTPNQLTVQLAATPIGFGINDPNKSCHIGPQDNGKAGFTPGGAFNVPTDKSVYTEQNCDNPGAVDFTGSYSYVARVVEPLIPVFVIGDVEKHSAGKNVNFWGAQWWKNNDMSGTVSNGVASFKGYATQSTLKCGGTWVSLPGNSSNPPDAIGSTIAVIVTSTVLKQGPNISGDIQEFVIVKTDAGYGPNPGHAGTGTVIKETCDLASQP